MEDELYKIISEFVSITFEDIDRLLEKVKVKKLGRQDDFITIGQKNDSVGFLRSGLLRSYFYDEKGNEQTTAFIEPSSFFSELKSYQTSNPSERTIEAIESSEVLIINAKDFDYLRKNIPNWRTFEIKYFEKILKNKVDFQRELTTSSKKEALELFMNEYPYSAKFAPRQYIASFLGMTPYTLSRIKL